jgi:hypothetical protein
MLETFEVGSGNSGQVPPYIFDGPPKDSHTQGGMKIHQSPTIKHHLVSLPLAHPRQSPSFLAPPEVLLNGDTPPDSEQMLFNAGVDFLEDRKNLVADAVAGVPDIGI